MKRSLNNRQQKQQQKKAAAAAAAAAAAGGANAGEGADQDTFIDVSVPGGGATAAPSGAVALHDFSSCTTKFAGLLSGGGLEFSVTSAAPTLSISGGGGGGGVLSSGGVDEFVATRLFLVPKLHASNRLQQVSASDLEVVIEHGRSATSAAAQGSGGGKPRRYFLCAVVSADAQILDDDKATPSGGGKLIGADAAMQAFLRNIDTSGGPADRAALRDRNAKLLPLDTPLTFPGVGECMSYSDSAGDVVLLAAAPLLAAPALIARLFAFVTAGGAPVFSNFDLAPAPDGAVSVVAFRANRAAAADATLLGGSGGAAVTEDAAAAAPDDPEDPEDDAGDDGEEEEGFSGHRKKKKKNKGGGGGGGGGGMSSAQVLGMVVLLVIAAVLVLPAWLYGPRVYVQAVLVMSDKPDRLTLTDAPISVSAGIKRVRFFMMIVGMLAAALLGVGAALGDAGYGSLLAGLLLALALGTLNAAVYFDLGVRSTSFVRALPNVDRNKIDQILFRDSYDIGSGGGGSK